MKKILSLVLALALLISCGVVLAEEAADTDLQVGHYTIINKTGEGIVQFVLTDNVKGDSITSDFKEGPLPADELFEITFAIGAEEEGEHRLTLSFTTESGKTGEFKTLSIEDVSIELLDVDAVAGATPIKFGSAMNTGTYTIINKTGVEVTDVTIKDNKDGAAFGIVTMAPDQENTLAFGIDAKEDGEHRLTLSFVADGKEYSFPTLSIEDVTIELLAVDAMTGATPIKFVPAPKAE